MLNIGSHNHGDCSFPIISSILKRTFPHTTIVFNDTSRDFDLVIKSHFREATPAPTYSCPYITWSGESYCVAHNDYEPLFEINTVHHNVKNNVYIPFIVQEVPHTVKPNLVEMEPVPRKYCAAYAFSNPVRQRERLFAVMRKMEPRSYSFGASLHTSDNPFSLSINDRAANKHAFRDFAFIVAMENKVAPGYITEKIGCAFMNGAVPIYWGDTATVKDFFNPASFIDVGDYETPEKAAFTAIKIWKDPQKLMPYLEAPLTLNNHLADYEAVHTEYRPWQKPMVDILQDAFPDLS